MFPLFVPFILLAFLSSLSFKFCISHEHTHNHICLGVVLDGICMQLMIPNILHNYFIHMMGVQNAKENRTKLGRAGNFQEPQGWGGAREGAFPK